MIKKIPFSILAGVCAMLTFFGVAAFIAAHIYLNGVAAQTGETVSMFANWWQTLLFVADIVFVAGLISCSVFAVIRKVKYPQADDEEDF
ncbi:MAG: hypothetical protein HFE48_05750 [Clostridia bacterium]|nr:hypothetical protein [Clostridia bacterium]